MGARRESTTAVAAVLTAALLVVLLVTWAASIGPSGVLTGRGIEPHRVEDTTTEATPSGTPTLGDGERLERSAPDGVSPVVRTIAILVEVATGGLVLFLLFRLARWLRQAYGARRRRDPRAERVDFEVIETPGAVVEEILTDAEAQRALLTAGPPANAIVECWNRFETQAAAAGLSRRAWETSSEFTLRVLELVAAEPRPVSRLAALYREARFSTHEMTEADRSAAVEALDAIHRGLRTRVSGRPA